ncbi:MAG: putative metal-binding motif-containing protein [Bacteroidetes bacterium]|nr:putative metal-binding motif-containing protein [Bacteroidota bacterium]
MCYCTPVYLEGSCGSEDFIDDFSTTGGVTNITNNNTGCTTNPNNYTHFAAQNLTIAQGAIFNVSMQSGPEFTEGFAIWIDYNIDGDFDDAGEYVFNSVTVSITIPYTATAGNTRMRIRCAYNYVPTSGTACATFNNGETEDYNVTITACTPVTYYADSDADNFGNAAISTPFCTPPVSGYVLNNTDCNDASATIYPGAVEICNGIDDDCNGTNDNGLIFVTYYADTDGDTYGNNLVTSNTCSGAPIGYVNNNTDCNDINAAINPGATEICNAMDDDCDASSDEGLIFTTYYADADSDTYGNNLITSNTCSGAPIGYVINNTDCNDANAAIKPGATEICNAIDDDCDASTDEGVVVAVITPSGPTSFCSPGNRYITSYNRCRIYLPMAAQWRKYRWCNSCKLYHK